MKIPFKRKRYRRSRSKRLKEICPECRIRFDHTACKGRNCECEHLDHKTNKTTELGRRGTPKTKAPASSKRGKFEISQIHHDKSGVAKGIRAYEKHLFVREFRPHPYCLSLAGAHHLHSRTVLLMPHQFYQLRPRPDRPSAAACRAIYFDFLSGQSIADSVDHLTGPVAHAAGFVFCHQITPICHPNKKGGTYYPGNLLGKPSIAATPTG